MQQGHVTTELLSAYLDTRVSEAERRQVESHLSACEPCSAALESLRRTVTVLRAVPAPRLPRSFVIGPQAVEPRVIPLWRAPYVLRAFSGLAAAAMVVLLVADTLVFGALPMSQPAAAPVAKVEAPVGALRQEPAVPASRAQGGPALREDSAAPAADAVAAERPAGTPVPSGFAAPPAPPLAGLRASEPPPGPGESLTASRAAPAPAEAPNGRLPGLESSRDSAAAPAAVDQTTVSAPEPRAGAAEPAPAPPAVGWLRLAAVALGLAAIGLWVASLRSARRTS